MILSIIIPTYNRANQLDLTLFHLAKSKADWNNLEIIIVDNGSTDNTFAVVQDFQTRYPSIKIKYIFDDIPGLLTGRHRGAEESVGEILTFIDDDVCVNPDWAESIISTYKKRQDITFLTGPNLPIYEDYPPVWVNSFWSKIYNGKMCTWLSLLDLGEQEMEIHPNYVWGLNFSIRKKDFYELGGFHPDNIHPSFQHFQGDGETGLTQKGFELNKKAIYNPKVMLYHQIPSSRLTFEYFYKRNFYQGVCDSFTLLRKGESIHFEKIDPEKKESVSNIPFKRRVKEIIKTIAGQSLINQPNNQKNIEEELLFLEIKKFEELLSAEYKNGYEFHRKAYNNDPKVKEWVHKETYFNYNFKDL